MDRNILRNEFASVEVARDDSANGVRLRIRDLSTGRTIYLDPLELESLARAKHAVFIPLVDPASFERDA